MGNSITPLISVIMPVYNVEKYIEVSVMSVCMQSFHDFELILVDDGSTDNSAQIAEDFLKNTTVYYRILHKPNGGQSSARNTGIRAATGQWVICVDSDDCIHIKTLEVVSHVIKNRETDAIAFNFAKTKNQPRGYEPIEGNSGIITYNREKLANAFLFRKIELIVPSLVIRRSLFECGQLYFDESCRFSEDQLFIWRLIANIEQLLFINRKLYYYLTRPNSIMTSSSIEMILTGYMAFQALDTAMRGKIMTVMMDTSYILPRWIIGTLHSTSKYMPYAQFSALTDRLEYKCHIPTLFRYPDKRISILSNILMTNKRLFYHVCKIV